MLAIAKCSESSLVMTNQNDLLAMITANETELLFSALSKFGICTQLGL